MRGSASEAKLELGRGVASEVTAGKACRMRAVMREEQPGDVELKKLCVFFFFLVFFGGNTEGMMEF